MRYGPQLADRLAAMGMRLVPGRDATAAGHIDVIKFTFQRGADKNLAGIITHLMNRDIDLRPQDTDAAHVEQIIRSAAEAVAADDKIGARRILSALPGYR